MSGGGEPECAHNWIALYFNKHSSHDQQEVLEIYKFVNVVDLQKPYLITSKKG